MATGRWMMILAVMATVLHVSSAQQKKTDLTPDLKYNEQCCSIKIMDSGRKVAIENSTFIPPGTYRAIQAKYCTLDPIHIQIWTRATDNFGVRVDHKSYSLRWEMVYEPSWAAITQPFVVHNLERPLVIQKDDVLGFFGDDNQGSRDPGDPANNLYSEKFSIPFNHDNTGLDFALYLSDSRMPSGHQFQLDEEVIIDDLKWPRSFAPYITFCLDYNCTDSPGAAFGSGLSGAIVGPPGPPGPPGPTGPAGENGQPGLGGGLDFPDNVVCDVPEVSQGLGEQSAKLDDLDQRIIELQKIINNIYNSNTVTGICPTGSVAGTYGVGSCYFFRKELEPMGVAEIRCRDDLDAHLVSIESDIEERFLRNVLLRLAGFNATELEERPDVEEQYWTSGMFNRKFNRWVWYEDDSKHRRFVDYNNWRGELTPYPDTKSSEDICSTLNVNLKTTNSDWTKATCVHYKYYICEIPKRCL